MATAQERKAFVKEVGRAEIEDAFNAIESVNTLTRGLNALNQAWNAATESDRRAFYREHFPANVRNGSARSAATSAFSSTGNALKDENDVTGPAVSTCKLGGQLR
jgi:hypothetical protein